MKTSKVPQAGTVTQLGFNPLLGDIVYRLTFCHLGLHHLHQLGHRLAPDTPPLRSARVFGCSGRSGFDRITFGKLGARTAPVIFGLRERLFHMGW